MASSSEGDAFLTALHEPPSLSQSTVLAQKRAELVRATADLAKAKASFREKMGHAHETELALATKQDTIREQVRRFEKFLRENDAKCARANRKAADEAKMRDTKEMERLALEAELADHIAQSEALAAEYQRYARFEAFFDRVCQQQSEHFETAEDVLQRHETLDAAYEALRVRIASAESTTEEMRARLHEALKRAQTESLVHNSQVSAQHDQLDATRSEVRQLDVRMNRRDEVAKDGFRQLGAIAMTIENLYRRAFRLDEGATRRRTHGPVAAEDAASDARYGHFLAAVQQRIADLQDITASWANDPRRRAALARSRGGDVSSRAPSDDDDGDGGGGGGVGASARSSTLRGSVSRRSISCEQSFSADRSSLSREQSFRADRGSLLREQSFRADRGPLSREPSFRADRGTMSRRESFRADRGSTSRQASFRVDNISRDPSMRLESAVGGAANEREVRLLTHETSFVVPAAAESAPSITEVHET